MKGIKDLMLDDSPKNVQKLEKLLAKAPGSENYFEAAKAEAAIIHRTRAETAVLLIFIRFPLLKLIQVIPKTRDFKKS